MTTALSLDEALARGQAIQVDPILLTQLEAVVGKRNVATSVADLICYSHDIMPPAFKWVRRDDLPYLPHMVVFPGSTSDVQEIVKIANYNRIPVIPAGGTSGTIGGILAVKGGIVIDMKRMNRLVDLDPYSLTVTVQTGMLGQDYEDQLNMRGFIGGHYPQSIRCSTVGGWIAPRGVGTFSSKYGKIEDIVQSLEVVLADGSVARTKNYPRSSCGPDMDQLFIGSEGTLGIITEATLRIWPVPEKRTWIGYGMPTFEAGVRACRDILASGLSPAVMRLYDEVEVSHAYKDLGYDKFIGKESGLYFACEGREDLVDLEAKVIHEACKALGGIERPGLGERWWSKRYDTAFLKKAYMLPNGIGDAIECASTYKNLTAMHDAMVDAIKAEGARRSLRPRVALLSDRRQSLHHLERLRRERDRDREHVLADHECRHEGRAVGRRHHRASPRCRCQQGSVDSPRCAHDVASRPEDQGRVGSIRNHEPRQAGAVGEAGVRRKRYGNNAHLFHAGSAGADRHRPRLLPDLRSDGALRGS